MYKRRSIILWCVTSGLFGIKASSRGLFGIKTSSRGLFGIKASSRGLFGIKTSSRDLFGIKASSRDHLCIPFGSFKVMMRRFISDHISFTSLEYAIFDTCINFTMGKIQKWHEPLDLFTGTSYTLLLPDYIS